MFLWMKLKIMHFNIQTKSQVKKNINHDKRNVIEMVISIHLNANTLGLKLVIIETAESILSMF